MEGGVRAAGRATIFGESVGSAGSGESGESADEFQMALSICYLRYFVTCDPPKVVFLGYKKAPAGTWALMQFF